MTALRPPGAGQNRRNSSKGYDKGRLICSDNLLMSPPISNVKQKAWVTGVTLICELTAISSTKDIPFSYSGIIKDTQEISAHGLTTHQVVTLFTST
jgi:hypothetical protein